MPLGWGSGVSSEAGICANMGLGERLLPRRVAGGVGRMAGEPRPPVEDASWPQPPSILEWRRLLVSRLPRPYWAHSGKSLTASPRSSWLQGGPTGNGAIAFFCTFYPCSHLTTSSPPKNIPEASLKAQIKMCFHKNGDNCSPFNRAFTFVRRSANCFHMHYLFGASQRASQAKLFSPLC